MSQLCSSRESKLFIVIVKLFVPQHVIFIKDMGYITRQLVDSVKFNHVKTLSTPHQTWILTILQTQFDLKAKLVTHDIMMLFWRHIDVIWYAY